MDRVTGGSVLVASSWGEMLLSVVVHTTVHGGRLQSVFSYTTVNIITA